MSANQQLAPPGSVLRSAREARNERLPEVADQLNMLVSQLQALEDNDYSKFNAELFVRGHIKSYAAHLGIPSEALLHDAEQHFGVFRKTSKVLKSDRVTAMNARVKVGGAIFFALAVWLIAVLTLGSPKDHEEEREPAISVQTLPADGLAPLRARLAGAQDNAEFDAADVLPLGDFQISHGELTLDFKQATWIQVRDAKGKRLLNGIQGQDKSVDLSGQAPFELIISSWQAVEVGYNGRVLDLSQLLTDSANTARLRIGELKESAR